MSREQGLMTEPVLASDAALSVQDLMARVKWEQTPLGPRSMWPTGLTTIVDVMLTSRFAMWLAWGPDLTFLCNDAYLPTVGIKRDWVIGSRSDKVWAEIWPDIGPRIEKVLSTGEATWDEALRLYLERAGFVEETYHTFSYSPLRDETGAAVGMLCVVAEVTERVLGERQLALLRDLGSRLAGAATRGDVMAALEASLLTEPRDVPFLAAYLAGEDGSSASLAACIGLPRGRQATPETISSGDAVAPWPLLDMGDSSDSLVVDVPQDDFRDFEPRHWLRAPDRALIVPLVTQEGGKAEGYLVAGLNPHRTLDERYSGFIHLLAAQVAAAIARADVFEQERRRAQALFELDRAKTAFFSNVSHEFRTPLTLMLAPIEEALAASPDADQRERLLVAQRNALRLQRLVNTLLDFSRIEAGKAEPVFQPTDLANLTADLASSFRSAMDKAGLRLFVNAEPLAQPVFVDPAAWEKIVLNLISNAFKFTFVGHVAVSLFQGGGKAVLTVSDTGVGIPAHEIPKLFDRFHRVEGSQGRSFEGSGIGLALVRELVQLHGGTISAESVEGRGTTFTVTVPMGDAHLPADRVHRGEHDIGRPTGSSYVQEALSWVSPQEAAPAPPPCPIGTEPLPLVLVADDNADLRSYISRLLTEGGYRVRAVSDGLAALAALEQERPAAVITDVMMPKLDGFGLLRRIRDNDSLRTLPVLMLSARAGEEAKIEGLDAGADDYLVKPFSARELVSRVDAQVALAVMRRNTLAILEESESRFRNMADHAPVMLWVTDALGQCTYVNAAWTDYTGQAAGEAVGSGWLDAVHPEDRLAAGAMLARANAARERLVLEYRLRAHGGNYRWMVDSAAPRFDRDGSFLGYIGSVVDIHDRKLGEAVLQQRVADEVANKRLLADIVEATDISVQVIAPDFTLLAINGAARGDYQRIYGVTPQTGSSLLDALDALPQEREAARAVWQRALDGESFVEVSWWGDGAERRRAYETRFRPLNDTKGNLIGAFLLGRDVTEAILEQERLALAEEQLRQAQKMEAMGQLTGGVAHDFNNLLTPIIAALDLLQRRGVGGDREQRLIGGAAQAAERARTLVQRLLAFARRQPLQATSVDVGALVADIQGLLESTLGPRIAVVLDIADNVPSARADANQLEMALLNLAVNARDAMPDGGRLILSVGRPVRPPKVGLVDRDYVPLSVKDTGTGMDDNVLARAVEPFFSTKGVGKGTGLGLSMVHGLASQLGGALDIQSTVGKGTTITLWLPVATEQLRAAAETVAPQLAAHARGSVLLVDDEDLIRASTADMLTELGYSVVEAASAEQALSLLDAGANPTLILTDHLMAGMTGVELASQIGSRSLTVPVLLVSGYADVDGIAAGMPRLVKPFRRDELAKALASLHELPPEASAKFV